MRRFFDLVTRFRKDEGGAFMVLFAVLAIVLIATSGAVVDFTSVEQTRTRAQTALDSAALALQPRIAIDNNTTLKSKAQTLLTERLADSTVTATVTTVTTDTTQGSIEIDATITKPTAFVQLVGVRTLTANLVSQATRKQLYLEVAMVLDNSISMNSSSRMTNLKKAARCATDILYNSITACDDTTLNNSDGLTPTNTNVKIGIVPFTEFVNVGTGYKTASWMTQTGATPTSEAGFDNDDNDQNTFSTAVDRFALYTEMNVSWTGCVEARNHTTGAGGLYYDTSDLTPATGTPDSMFVPIFAPDQPDSGSYANNYLSDRPSVCTNKDQGSWVQTSTKTSCTSNGNNNSNNYNNCGSTATVTRTQKDQNGNTVSPAATTEPATVNGQPKVCTDSYTGTKTQNSPARYTNVYTRSCSYTFSDRELQERLCKYNTHSVSIGNGFQAGPNADCGVALQPLTSTKSSVISKISAMGPDGGTNIHQGVMWGFHMLSPSEPLTEGRAYDSGTSKVMIVMTDGENTAGDVSDWTGDDWYQAYGYPYEGRITGATTADLQTEMDNRTKTTCSNARTAGITIYTIGLATSSTSNPTAVTAMLTNCATDSSHAYFPASSTDLVSTFQSIAQQLADLRLAK